GLKRSVGAATLSNLVLFFEFAVIIAAIQAVLEPLAKGGTLDSRKLVLLGLVGLATAVLHYFAYRREYRLTYTVTYRESARIRLEVAERLRKLPLSFFNGKDLSELTTNVMGDVTSIERVMSHVVPGLIAHSLTIVIAAVLLSFLDPRLALALFAPLPLTAAIMFGSKKLEERLGEKHVAAKLRVADELQDYLDGMKVVKAHGLAGEKSESLAKALDAAKKTAIVFEGLAGSVSVLCMMILQVGIALVVLVGVRLLIVGAVSPVEFLAFCLVSAKIYSPLIVVLTLLPEFFYLLVSTKRMRALREEPVMEGKESVVIAEPDVKLENVTFSYNDRPVLKDLTLTFPKNSVTALVGPSGGGKSTILSLIARFWDPDAGRVLLGGNDAKEILPEELLKRASVVFQDVVLFDDTIRANIGIGKKDATPEEIERAAKLAGCDEFANAMPEGYDTRIGENGVTLSGGERGRVSVARALLKNAPLVLLDEATASLDPENEASFREAMAELAKDRTVIVIAHSLHTVLGADNIAVILDGKVEEQGPPAVLLAKNGLFKKLRDIQTENLGWSITGRDEP
ncbi:MAG: ABC transporter ATP-binding protein/permease, partial [Deltaproteobacteria bacterium]|nr:ABC transporter ATP-binding protein/permease [Deltaproteobacteria bacterium]